jgi:hypothetical protein
MHIYGIETLHDKISEISDRGPDQVGVSPSDASWRRSSASHVFVGPGGGGALRAPLSSMSHRVPYRAHDASVAGVGYLKATLRDTLLTVLSTRRSARWARRSAAIGPLTRSPCTLPVGGRATACHCPLSHSVPATAQASPLKQPAQRNTVRIQKMYPRTRGMRDSTCTLAWSVYYAWSRPTFDEGDSLFVYYTSGGRKGHVGAM